MLIITACSSFISPWKRCYFTVGVGILFVQIKFKWSLEKREKLLTGWLGAEDRISVTCKHCAVWHGFCVCWQRVELLEHSALNGAVWSPLCIEWNWKIRLCWWILRHAEFLSFDRLQCDLKVFQECLELRALLLKLIQLISITFSYQWNQFPTNWSNFRPLRFIWWVQIKINHQQIRRADCTSLLCREVSNQLMRVHVPQSWIIYLFIDIIHRSFVCPVVGCVYGHKDYDDSFGFFMLTILQEISRILLANAEGLKKSATHQNREI